MRTGWVVVVLIICSILTVRRNMQWNDSYAFIKASHEEFPLASDITSKMAVEEYGKGNVKEARRLSQEAVAQEGNGSVNTYYDQIVRVNNATNLAVMDLAVGDKDGALAQAKRGVVLSRQVHGGKVEESGVALRVLMTAEMANGDGRAAVEAARRWVAVDPESETAWAGLRDARVFKGDPVAAALAEKRRVEVTSLYKEDATVVAPIRWAPAEAAVVVYLLMIGLAAVVVVSVSYAYRTIKDRTR